MEFRALVPGQISPTDAARLLRLDLGEPWLRLRLQERSGHCNFVRDNLLVDERARILVAGRVGNDSW